MRINIMGVVDVLLKIFKDPNDRKIKKVLPIVDHINNLEPEFAALSDEELKAKTAEFKKILSVETLTIMQLIGFNYKQAIGEPLTLLLRKTIEAKIPTDSKTNIDYILAMANIANDAESTKRFYQLTHQQMPEE